MLHVRSIAVSTAVVCFFTVGLIGSISGLSPWACCERAIPAAAIIYFAAGAAVRTVNTILIQAIVDRQINKERTGEDQS
jgi:hypothetical protein